MRIVYLSLVLLLSLVASVAYARVSPTLSATSLTFASSDSVTSQTTASGPSPAADGYIGTFTFHYSITGTGSMTYYVCYWVDQYDTVTSSWVRYCAGSKSFTNSGGTSGNHGIDFYADMADLPPGGYQLSAQVVTVDGSGNINNVLATNSGHYAFSYDDPLPDPEPSPGPDPVGPPIPTSGPMGPGSGW